MVGTYSPELGNPIATDVTPVRGVPFAPPSSHPPPPNKACATSESGPLTVADSVSLTEVVCKNVLFISFSSHRSSSLPTSIVLQLRIILRKISPPLVSFQCGAALDDCVDYDGSNGVVLAVVPRCCENNSPRTLWLATIRCSLRSFSGW